MWGTKKHALVSAGMTFGIPSEQWGPHTTGTVMWWFQCHCGETYTTQLSYECGSADALEDLVNGAMSAVAAGFSRLSITPPSQVSSTDLLLNLTQILTTLRERS